MVPQSFLVLRFAMAASATPPDDPTKPAQEVCSSRLYGSLRMAGLSCCRARGIPTQGDAPAIDRAKHALAKAEAFERGHLTTSH
jgi:hypothetical protein